MAREGFIGKWSLRNTEIFITGKERTTRIVILDADRNHFTPGDDNDGSVQMRRCGKDEIDEDDGVAGVIELSDTPDEQED